MNSTNNNNHMFVCELKELRNELSAVKKRIDQLEESHEKQQEKINILERENNALKKKTQLNGDETVGSVLKRKRTEKNQVDKEEIESVTTSVPVSTCNKKTKTNNNKDNNDNDEVVLSQRDNGDCFDSLSDDLLHKIVEFNGNCYSKFGAINKRCRNIYDVKEYKLKKQTCVYGYGTVDMMLERYLQKRKKETFDIHVRHIIVRAVIWYNRLDAIEWIIQLGDIELLELVCWFAAWNGRINILSNVFCKCNVTILDKILEGFSLCYNAADNGHLETLKWVRKYGAVWGVSTFDVARDKGHDEIVQYLRDEGCPEEEDEDSGESSENEQLSSDDEDGDN